MILSLSTSQEHTRIWLRAAGLSDEKVDLAANYLLALEEWAYLECILSLMAMLMTSLYLLDFHVLQTGAAITATWLPPLDRLLIGLGVIFGLSMLVLLTHIQHCRERWRAELADCQLPPPVLDDIDAYALDIERQVLKKIIGLGQLN